MAQIERIMAAVPQAIQQNQTITSTLTVSEPGVLALDRLVFGGTYTGAPGALPDYSDIDWSNSGYVQGLLWNGAQQLIRGRNNPDAPSGSFAANRAGCVIPLGNYAAQSADTLAMQVRMPNSTIGGAGTGNFTFCAPVIPENRRLGYTGALGSQVAYAASPVVGVGASGNAQAVLTADSDMVIDLSSITISALSQMNGVGGLTVVPFDAQASIEIAQITLPTGENLILGQGAVSVPSMFFSATRQGNWANLGYLQVEGGSTITMDVGNINPTAQVDFSFGAICYPASRSKGC